MARRARGWIAVESNFDEEKNGKDGRIGLSQVDQWEAKTLGIEEYESIESNTNAAIAIDLTNFEKAKNSPSSMYAAWRKLKGKEADGYNAKIDSKRDDVKKLLSGIRTKAKSATMSWRIRPTR